MYSISGAYSASTAASQFWNGATFLSHGYGGITLPSVFLGNGGKEGILHPFTQENAEQFILSDCKQQLAHVCLPVYTSPRPKMPPVPLQVLRAHQWHIFWTCNSMFQHKPMIFHTLTGIIHKPTSKWETDSTPSFLFSKKWFPLYPCCVLFLTWQTQRRWNYGNLDLRFDKYPFHSDLSRKDEKQHVTLLSISFYLLIFIPLNAQITSKQHC